MDYTYVSDSVLLKMKNQEQNQESSPRKTFFLYFGLLFCGMVRFWGFVGVFFYLVVFLRRRRRKE